MCVANREVGTLTNTLHRCFAHLVTSASDLHGDLRAGGLLNGFLGVVTKVVVPETAGRGVVAVHRYTHQSRGHAFHQHGARRLPWIVSCVCFAEVWAGLGHGRSQARSKSEQSKKRAVPTAGSSESEQFRKRALPKAISSESNHFRKRALQKASSSESKHLRKQALHKASTSGSKHLCNQHFIVQSKQRACQQAGHRSSKLKARIQQAQASVELRIKPYAVPRRHISRHIMLLHHQLNHQLLRHIRRQF